MLVAHPMFLGDEMLIPLLLLLTDSIKDKTQVFLTFI